MFPDMQVLFMMVLPLKASWIAVAEAGIYIYSFITGGLIEKIEIVISLILIGIFFGWMTFAGPSGFKQKKRSQEFQKTTQKMKVVKEGINVQSADAQIKTVLVWNSVIVLNVKAIMNIAWIICIHTSMSKKRMLITIM